MTPRDDLDALLEDVRVAVGDAIARSWPARSFEDVVERTRPRTAAMEADDLEGMTSETSRSIEVAIEQSEARPDFADVVLRAHELDPRRVDARAVEEVEQWGELVPLRPSAPSREEPQLESWVEDTRRSVEARVQARRLAPIPSLRSAASRRGRWGALAAAAAVVLLGWGAWSWGPQLGHEAAEGERSQAVLTVDDTGSAPARAVQTTSRPAKGSARSNRREPQALEPEALPEEVLVEPSTRTVEAKEDEQPRPSMGRRSRDERLRALAEDARQAWGAGDLARAESLLRRIVDAGGRTRHAELAFGDLFNLAHARGATGRAPRLWKAYLRRFPRGRYADDARAGLCRSAPEERQPACWHDYLEDFPRGSYRREAAQWVQTR